MINLLQRVSSARVYIENEIYSQINTGILLFVGLEQKDEHLDFKIISSLIDKIIHYRIFADNQDKMNLSVADIQGDILIVSQFTLAAETQKGLRLKSQSSEKTNSKRKGRSSAAERQAPHRQNWGHSSTAVKGLSKTVSVFK